MDTVLNKTIMFPKTLIWKILLIHLFIAMVGATGSALIALALTPAHVRMILLLPIIMGILIYAGVGIISGLLLTLPIIRRIRALNRTALKSIFCLENNPDLPARGDEIDILSAHVLSLASLMKHTIKNAHIQNQQLIAMFEHMAEGIILVDKNARIVSLNPMAETLFAISEKEWQGKFFIEVIQNNDIAEIINEVLTQKIRIAKELSVVWPVQKHFSLNASALCEYDTPTHCLLVLHDITELKRLEKIRTDFIANISHELKTPLTSIKGSVETLLNGAMHDQQHCPMFLSIIQTHTNRMEALTQDLIQLACLESKELILYKTKISCADLVNEVMKSFRVQIQEKQLNIENTIPYNLFLHADAKRIEQVFINLIDNAIKFNKDRGWIKIFGQEDTKGLIKICIKNTGVGIPEKDLPRIFERLYRVDKARSVHVPGTGLGLSIVKHIIELHGGTVGVESIEGTETTFWFTLPRCP